jgi:type IX secretion system PorP/SprF family membrane protein
MKSFSRLALLLVLCFFTGGKYMFTCGQDIHFTQFDYAPLFLNPANTGNFNGDYRVSGNFRNQWKGSVNPFRTSLISFDKQIYVLNQKIGVGAFFVNDEAGAGKLTYNKLYGSLGYSTIINNNGIGAGLQVGYVFGKVNSWGLFDYGDGTFTAPNGEDLANTNYLDINFGINYKRSFKIFQPEAGLSLLHVNKPTKSFVDDKSEKESMRFMLYSTFKTNINDKIYITPKLLVSSINSNKENIIGAEAGYNIIGVKSTVKRVFCGAYIRNNITGLDALMTQVGTTIGRLDIGISYDIYLSDINKSGNMRAFEVTFIYKSISTILNSYSIPCERY